MRLIEHVAYLNCRLSFFVFDFVTKCLVGIHFPPLFLLLWENISVNNFGLDESVVVGRGGLCGSRPQDFKAEEYI